MQFQKVKMKSVEDDEYLENTANEALLAAVTHDGDVEHQMKKAGAGSPNIFSGADNAEREFSNKPLMDVTGSSDEDSTGDSMEEETHFTT